MPEVGQVFAYLGIGKAQPLAELVTAGRAVAVGYQVLHFAEIEAQAVDNRLGNACWIGGGLGLRHEASAETSKRAVGPRAWRGTRRPLKEACVTLSDRPQASK